MWLYTLRVQISFAAMRSAWVKDDSRESRKRGFLMMTRQEARKYFGLGDNDRIDRDGILRLKKNTEEQLKVWSLTQFHREKLENEVEALEVLLGE